MGSLKYLSNSFGSAFEKWLFICYCSVGLNLFSFFLLAGEKILSI
uniref:Uncharacterized protein n=1 Tax=Arundo donax TaxID=35708 RepID=A0A0A9AGJ8_ARUDO